MFCRTLNRQFSQSGSNILTRAPQTTQSQTATIIDLVTGGDEYSGNTSTNNAQANNKQAGRNPSPMTFGVLSSFMHNSSLPPIALTAANIRVINGLAKLADDIEEVSSPNEVAVMNVQQRQTC
uniref:Uncharacterized protein n=1 Tax=Glossina austeni TaxID=7395 RepID=A0A1A9V027_GLOAU